MRKSDTTQQLTLLPAPAVPVQFRIDEATRRRGMQHVAEIKSQLAARRAARSTPEQSTSVRRQTAA
jgi:hypothetical protein